MFDLFSGIGDKVGGAFNTAKDTALNLPGNAASTLLKTTKDITKTVGGGLSGLANEASDLAADAAMAPLKMIEASISSVAGLGPDIVANRRAKINTMLTNLERAALAHDEAAATKKMNDAKAIVTARIKVISADTSIPQSIKDEYNLILRDKDASPEDLLDSLANADDSLLVHENKEFSGWRLIKRAWRMSAEYIYYILLLVSALFGGVILSNMYIKESYLPIRAYYFFYGTAFFPISLFCGIVNPPEWNATIFPWFQVPGPEPFVQPVVGGAEPVVGGAEPDMQPVVGGAGPGMQPVSAEVQRARMEQRKRSLPKVLAPPAVLAAVRNGLSLGKNPKELADEILADLEKKGVPPDVAQKHVGAALVLKGVPPDVALQAVSKPIAPPALTLTQRISAIGTELFGYKLTGGSSLSLRILSIFLSVASLLFAYMRGDLGEIYDKIYSV